MQEPINDNNIIILLACLDLRRACAPPRRDTYSRKEKGKAGASLRIHILALLDPPPETPAHSYNMITSSY